MERIMAVNQDRKLRFVVRLLIKHPTLDPDLISSRLDMIPRLKQCVGAARISERGEKLRGTYQDSRWGWSSRIEDKREFFEEVVTLLDRLEPHKKFLEEIVESGGSIEIIIHLPGDVNIGWTLPWFELKRLAQLKIDLGIEVFPELR